MSLVKSITANSLVSPDTESNILAALVPCPCSFLGALDNFSAYRYILHQWHRGRELNWAFPRPWPKHGRCRNMSRVDNLRVYLVSRFNQNLIKNEGVPLCFMTKLTFSRPVGLRNAHYAVPRLQVSAIPNLDT